MAFGKGVNTVELREIKDGISELDILSFYFPEVKEIPCFIHSPFRVDTHSSFGIYSEDGITIRFKDLTLGIYGSIYDMIKMKFDCSFKEALEIINKDKYLIKKGEIVYNTYKQNECNNHSISKPKAVKDIKVKQRSWKSYDYEFWESFGISKKALAFGDIIPISHAFICKESGTTKIICDKHAYAFVENKDNKVSLKIYQPFNKEFKWFNGHNASVLDLWSKLPKSGNNVIITSSRKDALNLWSNLKIPSISLQGEGYTPKESTIDELKSRFKNIFVFFDNDYNNKLNPGRHNALKLANQYRLIMVEIPEEYESKDPSDLYKNKGREEYINIMNSIFSPYGICINDLIRE